MTTRFDVGQFAHDLTDDWQVRALADWGESDSRYSLTGINTARLNAAGAPATPGTLANSFNPFNVANNNAALIADLIDEELAGANNTIALQGSLPNLQPKKLTLGRLVWI